MSADSHAACARADRCAASSPFLAQADNAIAASTPQHPHNTVTLLGIGQNALAARLNLIRAAHKSIDNQAYILAKDEAGMVVLDDMGFCLSFDTWAPVKVTTNTFWPVRMEQAREQTRTCAHGFVDSAKSVSGPCGCRRAGLEVVAKHPATRVGRHFG